MLVQSFEQGETINIQPKEKTHTYVKRTSTKNTLLVEFKLYYLTVSPLQTRFFSWTSVAKNTSVQRMPIANAGVVSRNLPKKSSISHAAPVFDLYHLVQTYIIEK